MGNALRTPVVVMQMWTVYDRPTDFPTSVVARRWSIVRGGEPQPEHFCIVADAIAPIREWLDAAGLMLMPRLDDDDPSILETWF